ncbi:MAG: OprO/OprP family phosphate-selective porin [bacterium]|nr:OprO/OprP family phosphate-selective porin [bacterium]
MKKVIFLLFFIFVFSLQAFAAPDSTISDIIEGEVIELDENDVNQPLEEVLKENEPLKAKISNFYTFDKGLLRIHINQYLNFDFGAIGDVTWSVSDSDHDLHTKYKFPSTDFILTGKMNDHVDYKVQMRAEKNIRKETIFGDVWVRGKYKNYTAMLGRMRKPFAGEPTLSPYDIDFATRAQVVRLFGDHRDSGGKIRASYKWADIDLGLFAVMQKHPFWFHHKGIEFNSQLTLKPLAEKPEWGDLRVSGGIATGKRDLGYTNYNGYFIYKYKKFGLKGEYIYKEPTFDSDKKADGYYFTGTYFLTDKLQAAVRFDSYNGDKRHSHRYTNEYTVGLNYYLNGSNTMFVLNYTFVDGIINTSRIALQMRYKTW